MFNKLTIVILTRKLGWRLGLQAVTGVLVLAFFLSAVYRSASLYHPQRRAILHLKNQRRKVRPVRANFLNYSSNPPIYIFGKLFSLNFP